MIIELIGLQTNRIYFDRSISTVIKFYPFDIVAFDSNGFRLKIIGNFNQSIALNVSLNDLVVLRDMLNKVLDPQPITLRDRNG